METIESDARDKGERIITEISKKWMAEDEMYSWMTRADCFRTCNLNRLAYSIEQHFGIPSSPETQSGSVMVLVHVICHTQAIANTNQGEGLCLYTQFTMQ